MHLTECEAIQLLNCILGNIGKKPLAEKMGMTFRTVSDAINGRDDRINRDAMRAATKLFLDECLDENRGNVSQYIASAYDWLKTKEPNYSDEIIGSIEGVNPKSMDGSDIEWCSIKSGKDLKEALEQLSEITEVAEVVKQCIQIESRSEHIMRINWEKRVNGDEKPSHTSALSKYNKKSLAAEAARADRIASLPSSHVKREWLVKHILNAKGSVIAVEAPAGYGKTTLLESIASSGIPVAAFVKCKWDDPDRSEQMLILDSISAQLSDASDSYRKSIERLSKTAKSPSDKINSMISAMQNPEDGDGQVRYILIDALDEVKDSQHILSLLDRLALTSGYDWLKVVCSTRRWGEGRRSRGYCVVRPMSESSKTENDIEEYALKRLSVESGSKRDNAQSIASAIAARSDGIFQYAVTVVDALCDGIVCEDDIGNLPSDIFGLYDWYLHRYFKGNYFKDNSGPDRDTLTTVLNMVAASPSPVPEEIITSALSLGSRRWEKTKSVLDRFMVCTKTDAGTLYSLFHKSFADYLFSSRHGGTSAKEEGVAFLALGCYRARYLDRLSYWANDYVQVYMVWLLDRANNNALLDVADFDLRLARFEVLHDESHAKSCLNLLEPASDVIVFKVPAREEVLSWSAMRIFGEILISKEGVAECIQEPAEKERLRNWLFSCNHYIFVLVSTSRFSKALQVGNETIAALSNLDAWSFELDDGFERGILQELASLYETIAYDVLTVGQPSAKGDIEVSDYYDKAISIYSFLNDAEGYLKATCNKALYEVEHVNAEKALCDIESLISTCDLQNSLLRASTCDKIITIANPCRNRKGERTLIKARSAFNHMNNLGYCLTLAGKEKEGLSLFGICEALAFDEMGADKDTLFSEHDKAELFHLESIAYYRLGEYVMVAKCEEKAIPGLQEVWGADSPKLCGPYNMIGSAYYAQHQPSSAIPLFEKALSIASTNWEPNHSRLKNIQLNLARAEILLASESSIEERDRLLDQAANRIDTVLDANAVSSAEEPWEDPDSGFLKAQLSLSELLEVKGELENALAIRERIVQAYRSNPLSNDRSMGSSLLGLSRTQANLGLYEKARLSLKEAKACLMRSLSTIEGDYANHPLWIQACRIADEFKL